MHIKIDGFRFRIGALIKPPLYSGQNDSGPFIVLGLVPPHETLDGFFDERKTWGAVLENDPAAGLVCLRLERSSGTAYCIWRDHQNVVEVQPTPLERARIAVRIAEAVMEQTADHREAARMLLMTETRLFALTGLFDKLGLRE